MILVLDPGMEEKQQQELCLKLQKKGFYTRLVGQYGQLVLSIDGPGEEDCARELAGANGIVEIIPGRYSYYLASRRCHRKNSLIRAGRSGDNEVIFGGDEAVMIGGPCAVESEEGAINLARKIREAGCRVFRGMIFKPRSSPYSFQGLGRAGIGILDKIKAETGLLILTEVRDQHEAELVADHADIIQVGTRNMSNFQLLRHLGEIPRPILLKRGMGSSIEELLCAAEYLLAHGNTDVILCERGIRTFEHFTRFSLDIGAVPALKELSHLPVIVDPSHASGRSNLVEPLSLAALAAGADGLMLEVHQRPESAFSDGAQSISPDAFIRVIERGRKVATAVGRALA
jgi:3-deoxy-7-phosphoheptulonate synthase